MELNHMSGSIQSITKDIKQEYNYQYYGEYRKLHQTAFLMCEQIKNLKLKRVDLEGKLEKMEKKRVELISKKQGKNQSEKVENKKRMRRTAEQISRNFVCNVERCHKYYGSEGSLQQHIKLKHPELYQSKSQKNNSESVKNFSQFSYN